MTKTFRGYVPIEPPEFSLESPDGANVLVVKCNAMVPGSTFLDFLSGIDEENPASLADSVYGILRATVRTDVYDEFKSFIDNPANGVDIDMLSEICGYLSELYAKRPTAPSSP